MNWVSMPLNERRSAGSLRADFRRGILKMRANLAAYDFIGNPLRAFLRAQAAADIGSRLLRLHGRQNPLADSPRLRSESKMLQHHGCCRNCSDRIGDIFTREGR